MSTCVEDLASSHTNCGRSFEQDTVLQRKDKPDLVDSTEAAHPRDTMLPDGASALVSDPDDTDTLPSTSTTEKDVASSQPEKDKTTFMTLPIELRTMVYKLALITETTTVTLAAPITSNISHCHRAATTPVHLPVAKPILNVNLLRASPQIHQEASQYAFLNRTFQLSKQCKGCLTHLCLNDSLYLKTLSCYTLARIENLEIPISIHCSMGISTRRSVHLGMGILLSTTAGLPALSHLTVIAYFFNHLCLDAAQFGRVVKQLDLDDLFTQVYRQIDARVDITWRGEAEDLLSMPMFDEDEVNEVATEIIRHSAEGFNMLQGLGGNARVKTKGKKKRRVCV